MTREQLSNSIGNIGLIFIAISFPAMIATSVATIADNRVIANASLFITILFIIIGSTLVFIANRLSK